MTTQTELQEDPQATRARDRIGVVLQDKWKLDSLLGVGGMAAVYAATHRNGKRVAVKMLHAEFSHEDEVRTRFLREGYAANTIQHDGAVSVLDDDLAPDGSAFLVMELLEGETVERRWERSEHRMATTDVLFVADQLLDVLAAAHDKNVVHRDIKPENLFITQTGALKVLDFGIAKVFERPHPRSTATRAGMIMGTPAFMAPEQARGRWDEVDSRTDLWAVGATMFTLLAGRHVHVADSSHEQLILSATQPAPTLASVVADVPDFVLSIVDRALAFDRASRWPSARAMQTAVQQALRAAGVPAQLSSPIGALGGPPAQRSMVRSDRGVAVTSGTAPASSRWATEQLARSAATSKLRVTVADLVQRYALAKKRTADTQSDVETAKAQRKSLDQWFSRRVGTRTAAVDEARSEVRRQLVALARRATLDREAFGVAFDAQRDRLATLELAAHSASRDVIVHQAALQVPDVRALRSGITVWVLAVLLGLWLLAAPIVWRATRVVEPPPPKTTEPHR
ncbi:MAG: serine/threonine-protein kinase [Polyangiaceae bacterium]|jgi:serine/threonine protein kinase